MIIKPYSTIAVNAFDPDDFPACKLFIPFNNTAGAYDLVSGSLVVPSTPAAFTLNGDYLACDVVNDVASLTDLPSTITISSGQTAVAIITNYVTSNKPSTGSGYVCAENSSATNGRIGMRNGVGATVDSTTTVSSNPAGAITNATLGVNAVTFKAGTSGIDGYHGDYNSASLTKTTVAATHGSSGVSLSKFNIADIGADTLTPSGTRIYAYQLWVFDTVLPTGFVNAAAAWTMRNHGFASTRTAYPGFKGLS